MRISVTLGEWYGLTSPLWILKETVLKFLDFILESNQLGYNGFITFF